MKTSVNRLSFTSHSSYFFSPHFSSNSSPATERETMFTQSTPPKALAMHRVQHSVVFIAAILVTALCSAETNWPCWRGPAGTGVSSATDLPVKWDSSNVRWKTDLLGQGHSSPVVWGDRIFLTSATEGGRKRIVMCLARGTGKTLWSHVAWTGEPEQSHRMNLFASATCATDGERLVAFFGRAGIHCYDLEGKRLWSRDLGRFEGPWGTAASPLLYGDLVIQNCDAEDEASIVGLDVTSGKTVWQTPRERLRGWSSPLLVETEQRVEVVVNGELGVNSYDPLTGKELWFCKGDRGRGSPTVTRYGDFLITVSGRPGPMFATKPGGSGTVNETHEVWRTIRKGGRDLPSPIVVGKYLIVVSQRTGLATCYDAASGEELDRARLGGNFAASPVAAAGLAYVPNEAGKVFVLKPGKKLEVVAANTVGSADTEIFRASIAPSQGELLVRSDSVLYCIGR